MPFASFSEQYYDSTTRRYIYNNEVPNQNPQQEYYNQQQVNQTRKIPIKYPTREEIRQAQIQAELERKKLEAIQNSAQTEAKRRFDPNRYHNSEQINVHPL